MSESELDAQAVINALLANPQIDKGVRASIQRDLEKRVKRLQQEQLRGQALLENWETWVDELFPTFADKPFAEHHIAFWKWVWKIQRGVRPAPFVGIWPRGGAKSASAEMACIAIGAKRVRSYIWYCCETQDQADKHVETIGDLLESNEVAYWYPALSQRRVGLYGRSRGWRRNRLSTASGLTIDAIGLDTARRGARVIEHRPDVMVYDDIDGKHDTPRTTLKKEEIITTSLLPAGSNDLVVIMMQNLIHPDSIFAQLSDGRAEFLYDREVHGPIKAVEGLAYEERSEGGYVITNGEPTWEGQDLQTCQEQINEWGITAFLQEAQHDVRARPGGIWDHIVFRHIKREDCPDMLNGCVWVDPAVTTTDQSDSHAIQADAIDKDGTIYRFYSWEQVTSPNDSIWRAVLTSFREGFTTVGIETDQGGETWRSVYREVWREMMECANAITEYDRLQKVVAKKHTADEAAEFKAARATLSKLDAIKVGRTRPFAEQLVKGTLVTPRFKQAKAGAGHGSKVERNARMLADYERGRVVHVVGTHTLLEGSLKRFPLTPPHDLTDASYWSWADLRGTSKGVFF